MTDRLRLYAQWTSLDNPVAGQYRLVKEVSSFENSFGNRVIGVSSPFFFYYHRSTVAVHAGSLCFLASSKGPRLFEDFSKLSKQARKTNAISTFPYVPLFFLFPPFLFSLSLSLSLSLPLSRYFCFNFFSFFFFHHTTSATHTLSREREIRTTEQFRSLHENTMLSIFCH